MEQANLDTNQQRVLHFIISHDGATKADLAENLELSLPTVSTNLIELEKLHHIVKGSARSSTGGRKATVYEFNSMNRAAIGIRLWNHKATMFAVNLAGDVICRQSDQLDFTDSTALYTSLGEAINEFTTHLHVPRSAVHAVCLTVSPVTTAGFPNQGSAGRAQPVTHKYIEQLQQHIQPFIDFPLVVSRESYALAQAEVWMNQSINPRVESTSNALCIYLNRYLTSSLIVDGKPFGLAHQNSGYLEHMTLIARGEKCYCGQQGCAQVYCSSSALVNIAQVKSIEGTLRAFFNAVREDDYAVNRVYNAYLDHLAMLIHNAHMMVNVPIILGGEVAKLFDSTDLADLEARVHRLSPLPYSQSSVSISRGVCSTDQAVIGAALIPITAYVDSLLGSHC